MAQSPWTAHDMATPRNAEVIAFWGGPIALHGLVHFLNTTGPSLTKVVLRVF